MEQQQEIIFAFLLTTDNYQSLASYCTQVNSFCVANPALLLMGKMTSYLGVLALASDLAILVENCLLLLVSEGGNAEVAEKIEGSYFRIMDLLGKTTEEGVNLVPFNANQGLVSKIGVANSCTVLNVLLSFFAGSIHHIRKLKKVCFLY